jgi:hypothetical protein
VFNPRQKRDRDGKFAGGGYVGRHHAKPTERHVSGSFERKPAKSRTAALRAANDKKTTVYNGQVTPVRGVKWADKEIGQKLEYRRKILSGEIQRTAAAPQTMAIYGRGPLPPKVAAEKYASRSAALSGVAHNRNFRQRRSPNPPTARKQKLRRAETLNAESAPNKVRLGRKPAFPNQTRAKRTRGRTGN